MTLRSLLPWLVLVFLGACDAPTAATPDAGQCGAADAGAHVVKDDKNPDFLPSLSNWTEFDALADVTDSDAGRVHSLKFLILDVAKAEPKVFFVHRRFELHYEFAHKLLPSLFPTRDQFDALVYTPPGKPHPHVVGTLLWYEQVTVPPGRLPQGAQRPLAIWFFPTDSITLDLVVRTYDLLLARLKMVPHDGVTDRLLYTPSSGVQEDVALAAEATLQTAGVAWLPQADLLANVQQQAMNAGVTFGTLRAVPWDQLAAGTVSYRDIVVLERLPLDLPLVGGTITEELQTPLAHVNVAAKTRGTPNLALRKALTDPRVQPLLGKPVRFQVTADGWSLRQATPQEVEDFWRDRQACRGRFTPKADLTLQGVHDMEAEGRGFHDSVRFGVKCANYAELRRAFSQYDATHPGHLAAINQGHANFTTPNLGVAFAEYDRHVHRSPVTSQDCLDMAAECTTAADVGVDPCQRASQMCAEVVKASQPAHLAAYVHAVLQRADFAADSPLRAAILHGFRWKIEHTPVDPTFGAQLDAAIGQKFGSAPVRLRSSTNAEDLKGFTGAGLYESFTAYATGPKRASLRIVKTWGSVWTFRAFEERSFWNIDHEAVYMGVEINPAFPEEKANGVLVTRNLVDPTLWGFYLNAQLGEESVTNPTGGITPEVMTTQWGWGPQVCRKQGSCAPWKVCKEVCFTPLLPYVNRQAWSSLSPGTPVVTDAEVGAMTQAMLIAQDHMAPLYGVTPDQIAFDVEWKVYGPERAVYLKQIRPY